MPFRASAGYTDVSKQLKPGAVANKSKQRKKKKKEVFCRARRGHDDRRGTLKK